jgi:hypothetical protein
MIPFWLKYQDPTRMLRRLTPTNHTAGPLVAIINLLPMKKLAIISTLILIINLDLISQVNDATDIIIDPIEEMPVFPGGIDSIWCTLERNFHYDILNAGNKKVKYITRFVIDTLGKSTDFEIIATFPRDNIFDHQDSLIISEIFRVLELMQTWQPAKQNNIKLKCRYSIPILTPYTEFKCEQFHKKNKHNSH